MSPAEREQVEAMLAEQGINMDDKGVLTQVCITPEMAKQTIEQAFVPVGKCATNTSPWMNNTITISYTCAEPPSSGEGEITFQSDAAYSIVLRSVHDGLRIDSHASMRWLNADCGDVKPSISPLPTR